MYCSKIYVSPSKNMWRPIDLSSFFSLYPRSLEGEGGILIYLCPSVQDIFCRIFFSNYQWQKSDIWSQASYRYAILWVAFLVPSDSYFLFADFVDFYTHWTYMLIFRRIFLSKYWWQNNICWEKCNEKFAYMLNVYKSQLRRQTGSRNLTGQKTLPTKWGTYMKHVTKYQISAINICWEKCDEKWAYMFNVYKNQQSLSWLLYTFNIYANFSLHFSQQILMTGIWYLVTSFI
jgi:hypothetical protein